MKTELNKEAHEKVREIKFARLAVRTYSDKGLASTYIGSGNINRQNLRRAILREILSAQKWCSGIKEAGIFLEVIDYDTQKVLKTITSDKILELLNNYDCRELFWRASNKKLNQAFSIKFLSLPTAITRAAVEAKK